MSNKQSFYEKEALETSYGTWVISAAVACVLTVGVFASAITVGPLSQVAHTAIEHMVPDVKEKTISSTPYIPVASENGLKLSKESKKLVYNLIDNAPENVSNIVISSVDFEKNSFAPVFIASNEEVPEPTTAEGRMHYPLITDSPGSNDRVLNLLGGHTDCRSFSEVAGYDILLPETKATWTCAVAIPPHAHKAGKHFGGFMTVMFQHRMNFRDEQRFMDIARSVARTIYERDVQ